MSTQFPRKRGSVSLSKIKNNHQPNMQPSTSSAVPMQTNNVYDILDSECDLSDAESVTSLNSKRPRLVVKKKTATKVTNAQVTPQKPPPLNISGDVGYTTVNEIILTVKKSPDDFTLRLTPNGIRVFSSNQVAYNALKQKLIEKKLKFYTHQLRESQTTKVVLYDLFSMPEEELKNHLNEAGVFPVKVKAMNVYEKRHSDHAVYLLYFLKSEKVKISKLREIPEICYVKVKWRYFSSKRKGPIQCSVCMQYGHGGENCFLDPVCIRCSAKHKSSECPLLLDPISDQIRTRIPDELLKCGLCGQNHSANFSRCVKRIEFVERQQRFRSNTQRRQRPVQHRFEPAPQLDDFNFPQLNPRARAERFHQQPSVNVINGNVGENDLFSPTQLMTIFRELTAAIAGATTKSEQLFALGEIAIKYIGNNGSR